MNSLISNRISLILSFVGLFISGTLSMAHYTGSDVSCGPSRGCDAVAEYVARHWGHFPVAYLGVAEFMVLAILSAIPIFYVAPKVVQLRFLVSALGTVVHLALTLFSVSVIHATCLWCLAAFLTVAMISTSTFAHLKKSREPIITMMPGAEAAMVAALSIALMLGLNSQYSPLTSSSVDLSNRKIEDFETAHPNRLGQPDAPIHVVEFFDLTCPHCKKTYLEAKRIMQDNPGKVCWNFRHFPINAGSDFSKHAALLAEVCAEEGKFFPFVDLVYSQKSRELTPEILQQDAMAVGVSAATIDKIMSDSNSGPYQRLAADLDMASTYGFKLAPVIFIGKKGQRPSMYTSNGAMEEIQNLGIKVEEIPEEALR